MERKAVKVKVTKAKPEYQQATEVMVGRVKHDQDSPASNGTTLDAHY
jgi:capsular polysaccharide biosynthesis protein